MPDWLTTFGVYDPTPANTTGFIYYLPTAHKSLVVREWYFSNATLTD
jgi:hypothetical protein